MFPKFLRVGYISKHLKWPSKHYIKLAFNYYRDYFPVIAVKLDH